MKIVRPFRVATLATMLSALLLSPTLFDQTRRYQATPKAHKKTPTSFHQWEFQARDESKLIVFVFEDDVEKEKWSARTAYSQT